MIDVVTRSNVCTVTWGEQSLLDVSFTMQHKLTLHGQNTAAWHDMKCMYCTGRWTFISFHLLVDNPKAGGQGDYQTQGVQRGRSQDVMSPATTEKRRHHVFTEATFSGVEGHPGKHPSVRGLETFHSPDPGYCSGVQTTKTLESKNGGFLPCSSSKSKTEQVEDYEWASLIPWWYCSCREINRNRNKNKNYEWSAVILCEIRSFPGCCFP